MTRSHGSNDGRPQLVGELLAGYLSRKGLAGKIEAASVIPEWPDLVGPGIDAVTRPVSVSEGTLIVAVASSPWMMELNMMKGELMRRLNAGKTRGRIEQIVFVMQG